MATSLETVVTSVPVDLKSVCTDHTGSVVALSVGDQYLVQLVGSDRAFITESAVAPDTLGGPWNVLVKEGDSLLLTIADEGFWARSIVGRETKVVVTEA